ncbi:anti-sigma factor [Paracoccus tegillarcae]|uniref:Anti-sigma K factor RskA C-terminal domain-containing protein n=1 Tax=Paracoccus tegillarcae TaxID=1529068 RepID=A0A2K9EMY9_9RHOB|nr:anti-sigma factor [Paracoccus tegillarcae]AUH33005.1 hypothetical protein CUV01_06005 [Paracoccus tegillarcae]
MTDDAPDLDPDDVATAGEYVIGTLPLAEREVFRQRLLHEPQLLDEVSRWQTHFDPMADEVRPVGPPDRVWAAVEARLFAPAPDAQTGRRNAFWRWLAIGATCAAAALLVLLAQWPLGQTDSRQLWVSDMVSADSSVRLTALYDDVDGEMRVAVAGQPPAEGRDFELWLIQGDRAPVSLGVMPDAGHAAMIIPDEFRLLIANATLAITDEPQGGAPGGVATGAIVAQAQMRQI